MPANVPRRLNGTATLGMLLARASRRKKKTTTTTNSTDSASVYSTSRIEALMVRDWSMAKFTRMPLGSDSAMDGSVFITRAMVAITLAPGSRRSMTKMARSPSNQAASF